MNIKIS